LTLRGVTILVLHDFDKSGFSIVHTLRADTRRHRYKRPPSVIDLGLRLADVQTMALETEAVEYPSTVDPRVNLRESGATEAECRFLVRRQTFSGWTGERVELNAMPSQQFLEWLEARLHDARGQKVVPEQAVLEKSYRRAVRHRAVQRAINDALRALDDEPHIPIPLDLEGRVRAMIMDSEWSWDMALWQMVTPEETPDGADCSHEDP
jgi:hypothetical protein